MWAAIGIGIAANSVTREVFDLPEHLQPGRHRLSKRFAVEECDAGDVTLHVEFIVQ